MNLTGTDKQIDFATTIVETITTKLAEMKAKLAEMDKGPAKNAMKDKINLLVEYSEAFEDLGDNEIDAGLVIEEAKSVFYKITNEWNV